MTKPTTVTLNRDQAMTAYQACCQDLAVNIAAVQWSVALNVDSAVYPIIARCIPEKRAVIDLLATVLYVDAEHVDRTIADRVRDAHRDRHGHQLNPYDIDAATAIDPAIVLTAGAA